MIAVKRTIPFLSLGGLFEADDCHAVQAVLEAAAQPGGGFFPLPEENLFQQALATHEGAAAAVAVNSCGTALDLCMMALGVGPGDEVIVPPLTFICTATCAAAQGAKVVFADIDRDTLCLSPAAVRRKLTPRTKAIIPVHFAGLSCDIGGFDEITRQTGVPVIYDAAHAVGTRYQGHPIGGAGTASCYSFQSNKNMSTLGEGGAVTTNDPGFAERVRQRKTFGFIYGAQLRAVSIGFNYRMTKPQLACGLTQLAKIDRVISMRLERFQKMAQLLADLDELILPAGIEAGHGCHLFVTRLNPKRVPVPRDEFLASLKNNFGVQTTVHYPAVYSWEIFREIEHDSSGCPLADEAARQVFSLPIFPTTPIEDLEYLADSLKEALAAGKRKGS